MEEHFDEFEKKLMKKIEAKAIEIEKEIDEDTQFESVVAPPEVEEKIKESIRKMDEEIARNHVITMNELSEEDREALELGRELQKRRKEQRTRSSWKKLAAAAVLLVLVGGVGVSSMGGPEKIIRKSNGTTQSQEEKISSSKNPVKKDEQTDIEQTYLQIEEGLGIEAVSFGSDDIQVISCEVNPDTREALVLFEKQGETITLVINCSYTEDAFSVVLSDTVMDEYLLKNGNVEIKVKEYEDSDSGAVKRVASFERKGAFYWLLSDTSKEDFEKMIDDLKF